MFKKIILMLWFMHFIMGSICFAEQNLTSQKTEQVPKIDGLVDEALWEKVNGIVTHDNIAEIDINIKTVYNDKEIFFLVQYPDDDESRVHRNWIWDDIVEVYQVGYEREDVFVLKWSLEQEPVDLSIYADSYYSADIWFWKAARTDAKGFADDKIQDFSNNKADGSTEIISRTGKKMYLLRQADEGEAAYKTIVPSVYSQQVVGRYKFQESVGSRADIQAKGVWKDGIWTIEFKRSLKTGYEDDIQFQLDKKYLFGVSRYEIAGRNFDPRLSQPKYGIGDVSERLWLVFEQQIASPGDTGKHAKE